MSAQRPPEKKPRANNFAPARFPLLAQTKLHANNANVAILSPFCDLIVTFALTFCNLADKRTVHENHIHGSDRVHGHRHSQRVRKFRPASGFQWTHRIHRAILRQRFQLQRFDAK